MKHLSKIELRKIEAVENKTPEGHLALVMHDEALIKKMSADAQTSYWKLRNFVVHLMSAHNALLDSSRSLEVKQAAASIEVSIDAKLDALNDLIERETPAATKRKKKVVKRRKPQKRATKKKAAPKKRAKLKRAKSRAKAA